jgi:D-glycero-alpha-D-manno-heptose-7-phosphate kinase
VAQASVPVIRSKAPLRISFAGGGTDVSPYPEERGGAVLNCTIDKFAYATLRVGGDAPPGGARVRSLDYNLVAEYERPSDLTYNGELDLVKAALKVLHPLGPDGAARDGVELFLHSDAPPGTGLGSSSTMTVALVGAFLRLLKEPLTPYEIAELAFRIEREELGFRGGRQDQYAAAFGGFNFMEFSGRSTIVNPLKIPRDTMNELAYRLVLAYTGTSRYSNDIIVRQTQSFVEKRPGTIEALDEAKRLAVEMKNELLRGNVDAMGQLLHEGWEAKKRFADGISNPKIDAFYEQVRAAGALGGKLVGAGGGGYLLLFCDFARRDDVARTVRQRGGRVLDFSFELEGLQTWSVRGSS